MAAATPRSRDALVGEHALVLGASISAMLAARVLTERYACVTLIDRDELPTGATNRRGVPQGRHIHALQAGGARVMNDLFPGFLDELVRAGAPRVDNMAETYFAPGRHVFFHGQGQLTNDSHLASRPLTEHTLRERLRAQPTITIIDRAEATGLSTNPAGRVTGAKVHRQGQDSTEEITADLVVDATGRSARAESWLSELGYP